ncbi:MAG: hypothetical protein IJ714_01475 [Bacteroidales bacterium]|nr:hypothetical protein [Bacteroidales bacterium]
MSKYIDAEKLIAEIERLKEETPIGICEYDKGEENGRMEVLTSLQSTIASLQQEQPSGLDEAAEKYSENILANNEDLQDAIEDAFKAGAEWMEGQGYVKEGIARPDDCEIWVNMTNTDIKDGDEVIVQIRKK